MSSLVYSIDPARSACGKHQDSRSVVVVVVSTVLILHDRPVGEQEDSRSVFVVDIERRDTPEPTVVVVALVDSIDPAPSVRWRARRLQERSVG